MTKAKREYSPSPSVVEEEQQRPFSSSRAGTAGVPESDGTVDWGTVVMGNIAAEESLRVIAPPRYPCKIPALVPFDVHR